MVGFTPVRRWRSLFERRSRSDEASTLAAIRYWLPRWRFAAIRITERVLVGGEVSLHSVSNWSKDVPDQGAHLVHRQGYSAEQIIGPIFFSTESEHMSKRVEEEWYHSPARFQYILSDVCFDPASATPWIEGSYLLAGVAQFGTDPRWSDVAYQWTRKARWLKTSQTVIVAPNYPNYYHFLIEEMPAFLAAMDLVGREGLVLLRQGAPEWVKNALRFAGFQWTEVPRSPLRARTYAVATRSLMKPSPEDWSLLHEHFIPRAEVSSDRASDRIYISRIGHSRSTSWEPELQARLSDSGWRVVDPGHIELKEQIELFSSATLVAGLSGAALANVAWMREGSSLVSLGPPTSEHGHLWMRLAELSGAHFHYINPHGMSAGSLHRRLMGL